MTQNSDSFGATNRTAKEGDDMEKSPSVTQQPLSKIVEPNNLADVATVPQALDNVWLPPYLLDSVVSGGKSLFDVKDRRDPHVRKEWRRILTYSEQAIPNRAFIFNNPPVYNDFAMENPNREAFGQLLDQRVIVPYLFRENPGDKPDGFGVSSDGWDSWCDLGGNERSTFVKLSNDQDINNDLTSRMGLVFQDYSIKLTSAERCKLIATRFSIETGKDFHSYVRDVIRRTSDNNPNFQRDDLYRAFIWLDEDCKKNDDGTWKVPPAMRRFDSRKPYSPLLKQLFDLKYNVNLPDFLGRYPMMPVGSLNRSALFEFSFGAQRGGESLESEEFLYSLRRLAYDQIQPSLFLASIGYLELQDILDIRNKPEGAWSQFIDATKNLLDHPLEFPDHTSRFYHDFIALNKEITEKIRPRMEVVRSQEWERIWAPVIRFSFEVLGEVLEVMLPQEPNGKILFRVLGKVGGYFGDKIIGKIVVTTTTTRELSADLDWSVAFMRKRLQDARYTWPQMVEAIRQSSEFLEVNEFPALAPAIIEQHEEQD